MKTTVKTISVESLKKNSHILTLIDVTDIDAFAAETSLPVWAEFAETQWEGDGYLVIVQDGADGTETANRLQHVKRILGTRVVCETAEDFLLGDTYDTYTEITAADLHDAMIECGSDPFLNENDEDGQDWADCINDATIRGFLFPWDDEDFEIAKKQLDLEDNEVRVIHTFVNGNAGCFCLSENYR